MAKKVSVTWVDDIDATPADETVTFAFDGVTYEIDLSSQNIEEFRNSMTRWIEPARRVSGGRRSTGRRAGSSGGGTNKQTGEIREWARQNGHKVSERGRISAEIRAAYEAAH